MEIVAKGRKNDQGEKKWPRGEKVAKSSSNTAIMTGEKLAKRGEKGLGKFFPGKKRPRPIFPRGKIDCYTGIHVHWETSYCCYMPQTKYLLFFVSYIILLVSFRSL